MATTTPLPLVALVGAIVVVSGLTLSSRGQTSITTGCGPTSLAAICRAVGISITDDELSPRFGKHAATASFAEIARVANSLGLEMAGHQMTLEQLRAQRPLGILHVSGPHFVALVGYQPGGVRIVNPVSPGEAYEVAWSYAELRTHWKGRILALKQLPEKESGVAHPIRDLRAKPARGEGQGARP